MTRFGFILLASCIPVTTTTSTSTSTGPRGTGQQAPTVDERAAMYEREHAPVTVHEQPGAPLDPTPRPCITAQNHCMRGGWFLSYSSATAGPQRAVPAYPRSATDWVDYRGQKVIGDHDIAYSHAMRTQAATPDNIQYGRPLVVLCPRQGWPQSEAAMLTSEDWYLVGPRDLDREAGKVMIGTDANTVCPEWIPIANARVIVEFQSTEP